EDGIRDFHVTGVQTCALPIFDQPSNGEAVLTPGYSVGILLQEPPLNEDKTVLGNVEEGVAETKAMLERFNEIAEKMAVDYSDEQIGRASCRERVWNRVERGAL